MIKVNNSDLEKLKKLIPQNHLIVSTSNYSGRKDLLGFIATFIINPIQRLTNSKYDNKKLYLAHLFIIYYINDSLWVGEMDKDKNWQENPIKKSNTFRKLINGQIRIFNLGKISKEELNNYLKYSKTVKYPLIGAISSLKLFSFLKFFRTKRSWKYERHCSEIVARYKPFEKYLKTSGEQLLEKYNSHHPEAIDRYLQTISKIKIVEVKNSKMIL